MRRPQCQKPATAMLHILLLLCAVVLASGLVLTTSTLQADDGLVTDVPLAAEASYLTRSYAIMRDQMRDGDLQAAAKTLSWIRQVADGDATVRLLAAELTLRNGRFALAAMQLAELIEAPDTAPHLRDEARLLLDTTALMRTRPVLALTAQLADEADKMDAVSARESPRYVYAVQAPDAGQMAGLRAGLRVGLGGGLRLPSIPPMTGPDGAKTDIQVPEVAGPDDGLVTAAITTPTPAIPGPGVDDAAPEDLMVLLFDDPGNLELNFALFQQQLFEDDLDGASATMERVLLIDPRSKLARVLLADVQLRKGNLILARNTLQSLLSEDDTPADMAARAGALLAAVDQQLDPVSIQTKLVLETGNTENAFGRANTDEILLLNLPVANSTPKRSDVYHSYAVDLAVTRDLDRQTPTLLEAGISVAGRDTTHKSLSDQRTISANLSLTEEGPLIKSAGLFLSTARVNQRNFNRSIGAFAGVMSSFGNGWQAGPSVSVSRSEYSDYTGIANNKNRTGQSYVGRLAISRQFENALINLALSAGRAKARDDIYSLRFEKAELSLASMIGAFSLSASLSRQWSRNDKADSFVSATRPKQRKDISNLKLRYPRGSTLGNVFFIPYLRFTSQSTESNIPNNRREGSEAAFGIETVF